MSRISLSILTLLSSLNTLTHTPVAYAQQPSNQSQSDCAGAGCLGCDANMGCRSSGLSTPNCVGAGCMGN